MSTQDTMPPETPAEAKSGGGVVIQRLVMLPPVLDATCGTRSMWFDKQNPLAIYFDQRKEILEIPPGEAYPNGGKIEVCPDVVGSFASLPFPDESFRLVVFDPPHMETLGKSSYMAKYYGKLFPDWECDMAEGFRECFRVLKPEGVLIFKWCSVEVPLERVLALAPQPPLFGHTTDQKCRTHWCAFLKHNMVLSDNADTH